jgi:membrane fusion protein (multidrug efflux system)
MSMPPMPVEVREASRETVEDRFEAVGTLEAGEAASLVFEIDGLVTALPFAEGGRVRRGEPIAELENSQVSAEVARAEALELQSHAAYDRVKSVVDQGAGSPQELDDAAAALGVADANLALAKARLAKTRIVAPFDGTIGARRVSVGAYVRAGETIAELADLDEIRIVFSVPERFLPSLSRGARVVATTTAHPGLSFDGTIVAVEPVLEAATRSGRVVARLSNPEGMLRPGMSAAVFATLAVREGATTIPSEAVFAAGDQSFVFVVKPDSTVVRTAVRLGTRTASAVEVIGGLEPGTPVVRAGHQKLFDGAKVMAIRGENP